MQIENSRDKRIQAVTFDCWQTLLEEHDSSPARALRCEALQAAARTTGRALSRRGAEEILDSVWQRHHRAWRAGQSLGGGEMARFALRAIGLRTLEIDRLHPELEQAFSEASLASNIQGLEGARETLRFLGEARIGCALVCDTGYTPGRIVRQLLDRVGLLEGLAIQVFSDEVGAPKPAATMFESALVALGAEAAESVHVGDLKRTDVAGARAFGMKTIRIRQTHDDPSRLSDADWVVDSHSELCAVLDCGGTP